MKGAKLLSEDRERQARKQRLKEVIRRLHAGAEPAELEDEFGALLAGAGAAEIGAVERELIDEGLPPSEVQRLCDVHVRLFRRGLRSAELPELEPGHPARILQVENRLLEQRLAKLEALLARTAASPTALEEGRDAAAALLEDLGRLELHYRRKENQLFPYLERHDLSGPTQVMWGVHDEVRGLYRQTRRALIDGEPGELLEAGRAYLDKARGMIEKEERVLLPLALEHLEGDDWRRIRAGGAEIGYAWHTPVALDGAEDQTDMSTSQPREGSMHKLTTGELTTEQLDLLLRHLPFDVTFVDEHDEVRYYTATDDRIFPRSPGIIGRRVTNCHPPKSVHMVEKIVAAFKSGERDVAEFYIHLDDKYVHIRYFALRDDAGGYRGVIEVSQDIAPLRKLEGDKRLLDWE